MGACTRKHQHPNKYAALKQAEKLEGYTRVYRCGNHWHITSQPYMPRPRWHKNGYGE